MTTKTVYGMMVLAALITLASADLSGDDIAEPFLNLICGLFNAFKVVAGAAGCVVLVWAALKYISSADDPGARKFAKEVVRYVIIGLIIVIVSEVLVIYVGPEESQVCSVWCTGTGTC